MNLTDTRAWGEARAAFWASPTRGTCTSCNESDVILYALDDLDEGDRTHCASCYRTVSVRDRDQPCDRCGQGPAFRNPAHRRNEYLCVTCHTDDGYVLGDSAMLSKLSKRAAGSTHPQGRVEVCVAKSGVTECKGQVKPRAGGIVMCDRHHDPVKWNKNRQV